MGLLRISPKIISTLCFTVCVIPIYLLVYRHSTVPLSGDNTSEFNVFLHKHWPHLKQQLINDILKSPDLQKYIGKDNSHFPVVKSRNIRTEIQKKTTFKSNVDIIRTKIQNTNNEFNWRTTNFTNKKTNLKIDVEKFLLEPIINPFTITYKMNDPKLYCSEKDTDFLLAVPSAPGNFARRQYVRTSEHAGFAQNPDNRAKLVFFLGLPSGNDSRAIQEKIDEEQQRFGDIVQGNFIDAYKNITMKAALYLHWASHFCQEAKYFIRIDDDTGVQISKMAAVMLNTSRTNEHFIVGHIRENIFPIRKGNPRWGKYAVSKEEWPDGKGYPPFVLGATYGITIHTTGLLLEAMRRTPFLWLDDVFVTGVCAQRLGVPVLNNYAFFFNHAPSQKRFIAP